MDTDRYRICIADKYGHIKALPLHLEVEKLFPGISSSDDFFLSQQRDYFPGQFKGVKKKLEIPAGFTLYGFKHTGAVSLYRATKDILLASKLCGHRSIKTTEGYLRRLGEDTDFLDNSEVPVIG